jgi:hypothetical protein
MRLKIIICIVFLIAALNSIRVSAKSKAPNFEKKVTEHFERFFANIAKAYEQYLQEQEDIKLLAEVIYHENWSTDKDKRAAYLTGAVVMNRVNRNDSWLHLKGDKTVYDVVYARGQYSTTKLFYTKEIPQECYDMARDIYLHGTPDVPADVIFQATFKQGKLYEKVNGEWFCYG